MRRFPNLTDTEGTFKGHQPDSATFEIQESCGRHT